MIYIQLYSCITNRCLKFSTTLDIPFHREIQQKNNLEYIACYSTIVVAELTTEAVILAALLVCSRQAVP